MDAKYFERGIWFGLAGVFACTLTLIFHILDMHGGHLSSLGLSITLGVSGWLCFLLLAVVSAWTAMRVARQSWGLFTIGLQVLHHAMVVGASIVVMILSEYGRRLGGLCWTCVLVHFVVALMLVHLLIGLFLWRGRLIINR